MRRPGDTVFYDIYTDEEKAADPDKEDTGLFFFRGDPGAKFAVCNAGGGFAYVGAMQDSFPHALELSKAGLQRLCADLPSRAPRPPAKTWRGPSALFLNTPKSWRWTPTAIPSGAAPPGRGWPRGWALTARRLSAAMTCPQPGAVVMQYTGHSATIRTATRPPLPAWAKATALPDWQTMQRRIDALSAMGIPTEFHHYPGLGHGFGLGTGTAAEGLAGPGGRFLGSTDVTVIEIHR